MVCPQGHRTYTIAQELKFEILFEIGANALLDGYYREAVASMTTSLERFYEFYIQVIARKNKIDEAYIKKSWNIMSARSEMQSGAFLALYLMETRKIDDSFIEEKKLTANGKVLSFKAFRNNVIHKGYIPTEDEAYIYGDYIYKFIWQIIEELKKTAEEPMRIAITQRLSELHQRHPDIKKSTSCNRTIVSLSLKDPLAPNLRDAIQEIAKMRRVLSELPIK